MVRVAHERARLLESGSSSGLAAREELGLGLGQTHDANADNLDSPAAGNNHHHHHHHYNNNDNNNAASGNDDSLFTASAAATRPVSEADFRAAIDKLKASVDEGGRELSKVYDWNTKYGEVSKIKKKAPSASMALYI